MIELTFPFILSQILVAIAMIFDILSFQFKDRKKILLPLIISSCLISAHYFLLSQLTAGILVFFSALRLSTAYISTNKKFLYGFIALNTLTLLLTYSAVLDIIFYVGSILIIIGNFQTNTKYLRLIMMAGTILIIIYNGLIFTPVGIILETVFLISNIIGYYRHHLRKPIL